MSELTQITARAIDLLSPNQQNVICDIVTIMLANRTACPTLTPIQALYMVKQLSAVTFGPLVTTTNEQWARATQKYIEMRQADAERHKKAISGAG